MSMYEIESERRTLLDSNTTPRASGKRDEVVLELTGVGLQPTFRRERHRVRKNVFVVVDKRCADGNGCLKG